LFCGFIFFILSNHAIFCIGPDQQFGEEGGTGSQPLFIDCCSVSSVVFFIPIGIFFSKKIIFLIPYEPIQPFCPARQTIFAGCS
jgi:hypothetical protein